MVLKGLFQGTNINYSLQKLRIWMVQSCSIASEYFLQVFNGRRDIHIPWSIVRFIGKELYWVDVKAAHYFVGTFPFIARLIVGVIMTNMVMDQSK